MKIGILTFHWAANYGAILQAYALSKFLQEKLGHNAEIIDYVPYTLEITPANVLRNIRPRIILSKYAELRKERVLRPFRMNHLKMSPHYANNQELKAIHSQYDVLIAGSDQIWNPYFLQFGEGGITPSYLLNFGDESVKRISVSASFGCTNIPEELTSIITPLLKRFSAISVRENTGKHLLNSMGFDNVLVTADPTSLLSREAYLKLSSADKQSCSKQVAKFILRKQQSKTAKLITEVCLHLKAEKVIDIDGQDMSHWLASIRDSKVVVTNSFHCVMVCLKMHIPFWVILESERNAGMNDRFYTLLHSFGLTNRIVNSVEDLSVKGNIIDFEAVDAIMKSYTSSLTMFLIRELLDI